MDSVAVSELPGDRSLELVHGDLTQEKVDAIVNAANSSLAHGGGLAAAIVRAGGPIIDKESAAWVREHGRVNHAEPAYTSGGKMPCQYVIHAVGPMWGAGDEDAKLSQAIAGSLRLADTLKLASIAIPPISTGIFGFPKERASTIFFNTIQGYFAENPGSGLRLVRLTILDQLTLGIFKDSFERWMAQGR